MSQTPLYPLRFEPIYQYRLWGGRRLASILSAPLPGDGPIGEAWVLSDRDDHPSRVTNGSLKGQTVAQVLEQFLEQVMGKFAARFRRFPLLLKFLDACEMLSVQVHPGGDDAGKAEAWVVLEAGTKSRIYAGVKPGTTEGDLRRIAKFRLGSGIETLQTVAFVTIHPATTYTNRERQRMGSCRPSQWLVGSSVMDLLIASSLATCGIAMTRLPILLVGEMLVAATVFAFIADFAKVPVFKRLGIA